MKMQTYGVLPMYSKDFRAERISLKNVYPNKIIFKILQKLIWTYLITNPTQHVILFFQFVGQVSSHILKVTNSNVHFTESK